MNIIYSIVNLEFLWIMIMIIYLGWKFLKPCLEIADKKQQSQKKEATK
jgi:hypothetical protein